MKKTLIIGFLLLGSLAGHAQDTIDWNYVKSRYYEKYKPSKNPTWVFPLIFKEGGGQRDTMYLVYHDLASWYYPQKADSVFGEKYFKVDTSKFIVSWHLVGNADSALKINAMGGYNDSTTKFHASFKFYKGYKPVTLYWDKSELYSDSLPFPSNAPAPKAEGRIKCHWFFYPTMVDEGSICGDGTVLMTDTVHPSSVCRGSDSIVFDIDGGNKYFINESLGFELAPWKGFWVLPEGITTITNKNYFKIYPNPASSEINIEKLVEGEVKLNILDVTGRIVFTNVLEESKNQINTSDLLPGIYFLKFFIKQQTVTYKLLKS